MRDRNRIKRDAKSSLLGTCAGWLMRLWSLTLRLEIENHSGVADWAGQPRVATIFLLWHNRVLSLPPLWWKVCGRFRDPVILSSPSKDGAIVEAAMGIYGMKAVRGSSSRRGAAAIIELRHLIREGKDVCVTPDGPKGPRYVFQPGVVKLAESTGAPLIPVNLVCESAWRLKTWDRIVIPMPFSKVRMVFAPAINIPRGLSAEEFEQARQSAENAMLAITEDV